MKNVIQTELFKKENKVYDEKYDLRIGDIVKLKNPMLPSDIGKRYVITEFMDSFEDEIVFCRLLDGNAHYQFLKKNIVNVSSLIEDVEKVDKNEEI